MSSHEDILHDHLRRMEAGEPIETCLLGVSQDIKQLLEIAYKLRNLAWPGQNTQVIEAQRSKLLSLESSLPTLPEWEIKMSNESSKRKPVWQGNRLVIFLSAAAVLLFCGIITLGAGAVWLIKQDGQSLAGKAPSMPKNPGEAVLHDLRGLVEVSKGDTWQTAGTQTRIRSGMHIRTGLVSSVNLVLYDNSQVLLGPSTELVIDELDAQKDNGARVAVYTQLLGTSEHSVSKSKNNLSRYEVRTTAATGTALGTVFKVQVKDNQSTSFSVLEGQVSVTGQETTVLIQAGETSIAAPDEAPSEPGFFVTGSGEVALTGKTWILGGQTLNAHSGTVIIGNPQVGDIAMFEGRLLADDSQEADLIVLLRRSPVNSFTITGLVGTIGEVFWTVNGLEIAVTDITKVEEGIVVNDLVQVEGLVLSDGTLQAEKIQRLEGQLGQPFEFSGVVQQTGSTTWKASGVTLQIDKNTKIDEGLAVGNLVHVTGWITPEGAWLVRTIEAKVDETRAFEFNGTIDSMEPWVVTGIPLETREWTHIDAGLNLKDRVQVKGQIMDDGVWIAYEIRRLPETGESRIILVGVVTSMKPWIVSGIQLTVDEETVITGEITLGMLVRVAIQPLADGTWKILKIEPVKGFAWGLGCQELTAKVISVSEGQIQLEGWPVLPLGQEVENAEMLPPNSVILFQICFNPDGSAQVIYIVVIYQPNAIETEESEVPEQQDEKVMICHKPNSKNPHIIEVSRSAVPAHLGHGDKLGPCP